MSQPVKKLTFTMATEQRKRNLLSRYIELLLPNSRKIGFMFKEIPVLRIIKRELIRSSTLGLRRNSKTLNV